jgi:hypothetical protein
MQRRRQCRSLSLQSSHLGGPYGSGTAPGDASGSEPVASRSADALPRPERHGTRWRDRRTICASVPMVTAALAIGSLRDARHSCTMANEDAPRRRAKEVGTSGGSLQVPKPINKVVSAPNIRVHGEHSLRQRVPWPRRISMPIMPQRSGGPCAAHGLPVDGRPRGMPKQPRDGRGCDGCTGWCTIGVGSIVPSEKFPRSLWASSRGGCRCRQFSRFTWHK